MNSGHSTSSSQIGEVVKVKGDVILSQKWATEFFKIDSYQTHCGKKNVFLFLLTKQSPYCNHASTFFWHLPIQSSPINCKRKKINISAPPESAGAYFAQVNGHCAWLFKTRSSSRSPMNTYEMLGTNIVSLNCSSHNCFLK